MGEFSGFHLKLKGYRIFIVSITQLFFQSILWCVRSLTMNFFKTTKAVSNKKAQKISYEKDCFYVGYLKFFWPFLF